MSYSIKATITLFNNVVNLVPNPEIPHRIESKQGFKLGNDQIDKFTSNFGANIPSSLLLPKEIKVSEIVIDTSTNEFQVCVDADFQDPDFFLNKFPDVFTLNSVQMYIASEQTDTWDSTTIYKMGAKVYYEADKKKYECITDSYIAGTTPEDAGTTPEKGYSWTMV